MNAGYISKYIESKISASSRISIKIGENFYTIEAAVEKTLPQNITQDTLDAIDMDKEWDILFDSINEKVDKQVEDINRAYNPQK